MGCPLSDSGYSTFTVPLGGHQINTLTVNSSGQISILDVGNNPVIVGQFDIAYFPNEGSMSYFIGQYFYNKDERAPVYIARNYTGTAVSNNPGSGFLGTVQFGTVATVSEAVPVTASFTLPGSASMGNRFVTLLDTDGSLLYTQTGVITMSASRELIHSSGLRVHSPITIPAGHELRDINLVTGNVAARDLSGGPDLNFR